MPDHSTANPGDLAKLAQEICPSLTQIKTKETVFSALEEATQEQQSDQIIVIAGSLYLIGHLLGHLPSNVSKGLNN